MGEDSELWSRSRMWHYLQWFRYILINENVGGPVERTKILKSQIVWGISGGVGGMHGREGYCHWMRESSWTWNEILQTVYVRGLWCVGYTCHVKSVARRAAEDKVYISPTEVICITAARMTRWCFLAVVALTWRPIEVLSLVNRPKSDDLSIPRTLCVTSKRKDNSNAPLRTHPNQRTTTII
jgi:hypothetical protein